MNCIYVRFDKTLDYKSVVNSFYVKKFLESAFGEFPTMVTPTKFTFDRDKLAKHISDQFEKSEDYVVEKKVLPKNIIDEYYFNRGVNWDGEPFPLHLQEFEPEDLLDDNLVVITDSENFVLGVFATEYDFEKIVGEL